MSYTLDDFILSAQHVPLGARCLVEVPAAEETQARSLIHIPDSAKDAPLRGVVRALGPLFQLDLPSDAPAAAKIAEGDHVLFGRYGGHQLEFKGGRRYVYLEEGDVIARLVPPTPPDA